MTRLFSPLENHDPFSRTGRRPVSGKVLVAVGVFLGVMVSWVFAIILDRLGSCDGCEVPQSYIAWLLGAAVTAAYLGIVAIIRSG